MKIDYDAIKLCAVDAAPFECCGLILKDGTVKRTDNWARDKRVSFVIPSHEIERAMKRQGVAGVFHSHVGTGAYLSPADKAGAMNGLYVVAAVGKDGSCNTIRTWFVDSGHFAELKG